MTTPSAPNAPQDANERIDAIGDEHVGTSIDTPLRPDAFDLSDEAKIKAIESKFRDIMEIMGLDLTDDSLAGTPLRVAKMYVQEIFAGLNPANHPSVKTFDNIYGYDHMLVERNITLNSTCEHHFLPIVADVLLECYSGHHDSRPRHSLVTLKSVAVVVMAIVFEHLEL